MRDYSSQNDAASDQPTPGRESHDMAYRPADLTDWPSGDPGNAGHALDELAGRGGSGDVVGPGSSTDNAVVRFDSTTGKLIQNSGVIIDDSNNVTGVTTLTATAATLASLTSAGALAITSQANGDISLTPNGTGEVTFGSDALFGADNRAVKFGAGTDASIYYDGTNLVLDPKLVGTGGVILNNDDKLLFRSSSQSISSPSANGLSFDAGAAYQFDIGGTYELSIATKTMTFNNGAVDTSLSWAGSGELRVVVGATTEFAVDANTIDCFTNKLQADVLTATGTSTTGSAGTVNIMGQTFGSHASYPAPKLYLPQFWSGTNTRYVSCKIANVQYGLLALSSA